MVSERRRRSQTQAKWEKYLDVGLVFRALLVFLAVARVEGCFQVFYFRCFADIAHRFPVVGASLGQGLQPLREVLHVEGREEEVRRAVGRVVDVHSMGARLSGVGEGAMDQRVDVDCSVLPVECSLLISFFLLLL